MRAFAVLLALACALAPGTWAVPGEPPVSIGIRVDGGPFARKDPHTGQFRGYLVDLCTEAVTRAGFTFVPRPITATQRVEILRGDIVVGEGDGSWELDLLCDPTTLSLKRLAALAALPSETLAFSPIVYVANGGYVELKDRRPRERHPSWDCADLRSQVYVAGYVVGATSRTILLREANADKTTGRCMRAFPGHDAAVKELCAGAIDFYFGDLDVIEFYRTQAAEDGCAAIVPPQRVLSYEPYSLLVSNATAGFRPRFLAALYELFSDGTANQRFASHFPDATRSTALNLLFRINSVPGLRDE